MDYDKPQDAPETITAADGKTTLHRFRVDAVVFAPDRATAERRLYSTMGYMDAARLTGGSDTALNDMLARARAALDGDSYDDEHDSLIELIEYLEESA
jgi:hypothetical protein